MYHYIIRKTDNVLSGNKAEIKTFAWEENGYKPQTDAYLTCGEKYLHLYMKCSESNPFRRFTEPYDHVWLDSCMEFFFSVNDSSEYFNFECNANGAFYLCYGTNIGDNTRRTAQPILVSPPITEINDNCWTLKADFSLSEIKKTTQSNKIGYLRGNFFKCGDECPLPHYGMWSPVASETPQFHLPEYFGRLDFEKNE
ncbi:MAG: carbohydrate-binding family 9-like protein [Clostridia bacterium]|nr:carbohydrate-binding family 9-like protein [Clostridia bacterium]